MIHTGPNPRYSQLRLASAVVALLAALAAGSGLVGSGSVLAWAVATIAVIIFAATFYLKC